MLNITGKLDQSNTRFTKIRGRLWFCYDIAWDVLRVCLLSSVFLCNPIIHTKMKGKCCCWAITTGCQNKFAWFHLPLGAVSAAAC